MEEQTQFEKFVVFLMEFNELIDEINKDITKRKTAKIKFSHTISLLTLMAKNGYSYNIANANLQADNIINVTSEAFKEKLKGINLENFNKLNEFMRKHLYDCKQPKRRYIAVDGTYINLSKLLEKEGYPIYNNQQFTTVMVMCLYDITNGFPITYELFTRSSELNALKTMLDYVNENDVLVMDRAYFSYEFVDILKKKGIQFLCRISRPIARKYIGDNNDVHCRLKYRNYKFSKPTYLRFVYYKLGDYYYYFATTLLNKTIDEIKTIYHDRWVVEVHFRHSKYDLSLERLASITKIRVEQDLAIHNFIFLFDAYLRKYINGIDITKFKINSKLCIDFSVNRILNMLLYGTKPINELYNDVRFLLGIIKKNPIKIINNRQYDRRKIFPKSRFGPCGKLQNSTKYNTKVDSITKHWDIT